MREEKRANGSSETNTHLCDAAVYRGLLLLLLRAYRLFHAPVGLPQAHRGHDAQLHNGSGHHLAPAMDHGRVQVAGAAGALAFCLQGMHCWSSRLYFARLSRGAPLCLVCLRDVWPGLSFASKIPTPHKRLAAPTCTFRTFGVMTADRTVAPLIEYAPHGRAGLVHSHARVEMDTRL